MKLSEYFDKPLVSVDGSFSQIDEVDTTIQDSLVYCLNHKYLIKAIENGNVSCIITGPDLSKEVRNKGLVVSPDPRLSFFQLYTTLTDRGLNHPRMEFGTGSNCTIRPTAVVSSKVKMGNNVVIGDHCVIEDYTVIGDNSFIAPGVVLGAEGLITVTGEQEKRMLIRHAGGVEIGRNVAILSNSVVVKSLFKNFTRIGDDTQIGVLSNIGHGARIGNGCVISGNCMIAGRTVLEDNVWVGASASIAQGLRIGRNAQIKVGSVVIQDVREQEMVSGNFALPHAKNMKQFLREQHG